MFEQKINPVAQYNYQIQNLKEIEKIKTYKHFAIENIDQSLLMRVRRLLPNDWITFQYNDNNLIWSIPLDVKNDIINYNHTKLESIGLKILKVRQLDAIAILEECKNDLTPSSWHYITDIATISFPIMLNKRMFWLSKEIKVQKKISLEELLDLLNFKFGYEHEYGYDFLEGKKEEKLNSNELKDILFDLFSIRGNRMLDISTFNNTVSVNIRFKEKKLESSNYLALSYISEFNDVFTKIEKILS